MLGPNILEIPALPEVGQDVRRVGQRVGAEKYPTHAHEEEGDPDLQRVALDTADREAHPAHDMITRLSGRRTEDEVDAVQEAPDDKRPVGAMPESADSEGHHEVQVPARLGNPVSAHGIIDIIPELGGQRDMPAAPEFRDRFGVIRIVEILHQPEPEDPSRADGDVGIP